MEQPGWKLEQEFDLAELRRGSSRAIRDFFERYYPLLVHQARSLGVDVSARRTVVTTFLDDIVLELIGSRTTPKRLTPYVTVAFRHYVARDDRRSERRGSEVDLELADNAAGTFTSSEKPSEALRTLCDMACAGLTDAELELTTYLVERVPARQVAQWLGIEHSAAKVRLHRLKLKLRTIVGKELVKLPPQKRAEVERVIARAGYSTSAPADTKVAEANIERLYDLSPPAPNARERGIT